MDPNPYQAPLSAVDQASIAYPRSDIPDPVADALRNTRPWVRFLAVMGFIGSGFMVLAGVVLLLAGSLTKMPGWIGLVYLPLGAFYVPPSLFLYRYGGAIEIFLREPTMDNLGGALGHQKSFWRFIGIFTAAILVLYSLAIVVAVLVGVGAAVLHK